MPIVNGKAVIIYNAASGEFDDLLAATKSHHAIHEPGGTDLLTALDGGGTTRTTKIQTRRATSSQWVSTNPILAVGEIGLETDSSKLKFGDGVTAWNSLAYFGIHGDGNAAHYLNGQLGWVSIAGTGGTAPLHETTHRNGGTDPLSILNLAGFPGGTSTFLCANGTFAASIAAAHAATHQSAGSDPLGITTLSGFPGGSANYLRADGLFTPPPASGSAFRPYKTVGPTGSGADYECNGSNDNTQIQAAITAAVDGSEIVFLKGTYNISSLSGSKSITLRGTGNLDVIFNIAGAGSIVFAGATTIATRALSANSIAGTNTITFASGTSLVAGQLVRLYNNTLWNPSDASLLTGELYYAASVSGATITLNEPLIRTYNTSASSAAIIYTPISVKIENIKFIGASDVDTTTMMNLRGCIHSKIKNCEFGMSGTYLCEVDFCYDVVFDSCYFHDCQRSGTGYGVAIGDASASIHIKDCTIERCRHTIACGYAGVQGVCRDVFITNNHLVGSSVTQDNTLDSHIACINYVITGNVIHAIAPSFAVVNGCESFIFNNNWVYGNGVTSRSNMGRGHGIIEGNHVYGGILYEDNYADTRDSLKINGNVCTGGTRGIYITNEAIKSLTIQNNTIRSCSGRGIEIAVPAAIASASTINVSGNTMDGIGGDAVYIKRLATTYKVHTVISNNIITNLAVSSAGIWIKDIIGASIVGNNVYDDLAQMSYAIYEDAGCDYNIFSANVMGGGAHTINITGSSSVQDNNITAT